MTVPAWSPKLVNRLDVDPTWSLIEDVHADVVRAWIAVEDGELSKAEKLLGELAASLRSRREEIEEKTRRGSVAA